MREESFIIAERCPPFEEKSITRIAQKNIDGWAMKIYRLRIPVGTRRVQDQMLRVIGNISARLKFLKCIAERIHPRDPGQPNLRI